MLIAAATAAASATKPPAVNSNPIPLATGPVTSASPSLARSLSFQSSSAAAAQAHIAANPNSSLCKLQAGNFFFRFNSFVSYSKRLYYLILLCSKCQNCPLQRGTRSNGSWKSAVTGTCQYLNIYETSIYKWKFDTCTENRKYYWYTLTKHKYTVCTLHPIYVKW